MNTTQEDAQHSPMNITDDQQPDNNLSATESLIHQHGAIIPVELISPILSYLVDDKAAMLQCNIVNSTFLRETRPWLFRKLRLSGDALLTCLRILARDAATAAFVHELSFSQEDVSPTLDDWIVVRDAFRAMVNLSSLEMLLISKQALWALEISSPTLRTVALRCNWAHGLEDWLAERPQIRTLYYYIHTGPSYGLDIPIETLPNLETIHGRFLEHSTRHVSLCDFIPGRPIREVRLSHSGDRASRHREEVSTVSHACLQAVGPLRRLVIDASQKEMLRHFATTFPTIKELIVCVSNHRHENSDALRTALRSYPALHRIEFRVEELVDTCSIASNIKQDLDNMLSLGMVQPSSDLKNIEFVGCWSWKSGEANLAPRP